MCQAIKHALQVRNGRVGVSPPKESVSRKQQGHDKEGQRLQSDIIPGLVSDDSASVVGADAAGHLGEHVQLRLVLGEPYGRTEDYERRRVCREVHDGLASCLDFPPDWLTVSPVGCDESGFLVRVTIFLPPLSFEKDYPPIQLPKIFFPASSLSIFTSASKLHCICSQPVASHSFLRRWTLSFVRVT
jgi:hypothetical protein